MINIFVKKYKVKTTVISIFACGAANSWILIDEVYRVISQLIAFSTLAAGLVMIGCIFRVDSKILKIFGKAFLSINLIHIGLTHALMSKMTETDFQILLFLMLTIIGTIIVYKADKAYVKYLKKGEIKFEKGIGAL